MWTISDPARRPGRGRCVGAEARRQPIGQPAGVDTSRRGQHRLLDQPAVVDGHHVAERRRPAGAADGPQVHERRPVGVEPAGRGVEHDAVRRLPCGGRRRSAGQTAATGGVDDAAGRRRRRPPARRTRLPHVKCWTPWASTSSAFEPRHRGDGAARRRPARRTGARPPDGAWCGRRRTVRRRRSRPAGGRPRRRPTWRTSPSRAGRCRRRRRDAPRWRHVGGQGQPGRTVPDHGDVQLRTGHGQPTRSSAAILRNCSTTSGVRCAGSWERYTVSTLTAIRPASPSESKRWSAPSSWAISRAASQASIPARLALARLRLDVRQVVADGRDAGLVRHRTVPGHDHLDVHPQHQVAGGDPVGQRARPHDRLAADEQDVAREHGAGVRDDGDQVALGVRRADLDQLDLPPADLQPEPAVERAGRRRQLDAVEVELAEEAAEQVTDLAGRVVQGAEHRRRYVVHLLGGGRGGDDLGVGDQLVAVAVVAVGVGVDDGGDRRRPCRALERLEHLGGQAEVEQRVDEQRRTVADDETGVAPAPRPVTLDVGQAPVTRRVHAAVGDHVA